MAVGTQHTCQRGVWVSPWEPAGLLLLPLTGPGSSAVALSDSREAGLLPGIYMSLEDFSATKKNQPRSQLLSRQTSLAEESPLPGEQHSNSARSLLEGCNQRGLPEVLGRCWVSTGAAGTVLRGQMGLGPRGRRAGLRGAQAVLPCGAGAVRPGHRVLC